jgi:TRAP-type C4-dicarboxylate transport system substrate-binding protein
LKKFKLCMLLVAIILLALPILSVACAKEAPSTPSTPTTPSTPVKPEQKPIELSLASMNAPGSQPALQLERWMERIAKDSNGMLTIRHYPSSTLVAGPDMRVGVKEGVADLGDSFIYKVDPGFEVGQYLTQLVRGLNVPDGVSIFNDIWTKFPDLMASQWKDYKVIWITPTQPTLFYTIDKAVRKMDDLKGLEIRVPNAILADFVKNLGGSPISMSTPDWITSLDKGTTDGGATTVGSMLDFKIAEKFKYATRYPMGSSINFLIMNKEKWESLSPDLQKVIDDTLEWTKQDAIDTWTKAEADSLKFSEDNGTEFITLSSDEYAKWEAAVKPIYDKMAADMDAAGYSGTELVKYSLERTAFYANK